MTFDNGVISSDGVIGNIIPRSLRKPTDLEVLIDGVKAIPSADT